MGATYRVAQTEVEDDEQRAGNQMTEDDTEPVVKVEVEVDVGTERRNEVEVAGDHRVMG